MKSIKHLPSKLVFLFFSFSSFLHAQFAPPVRDSIFSNVMKEQRNLQILLPEEYKTGSAEKYDVLYLLDGEWNSGLVSEVQSWLKRWSFTPSLLVVGIKNTYINNNNQRGRDLTPTAIKNSPTSGGGPLFLSFIKNELVPYINKTYPSSGSNILFGHSLGGLFVLYSLFSEPQLFNAYIAADPSIWWDNGYMLKLADRKMNDVKGIKSLFITGRTGRPYSEMKIDSMDMLLTAKAPANLQWKTVTYPDEAHISQQYKSAYDGIKYSCTPSLKKDRIDFDPMDGIVLKDKPFKLLRYNLIPEKFIRYTTDGSDPQMTSSILNSENNITLQENASIRIKSFFANESDDKTTTGHFTTGNSLPAFKIPVNAKSGSFNYACYKDAGGKQLLKSGILTEQMDINHLADADSFYNRISGFLETEKAGYYTFEMSGEKGAKLYVGNQLLIELKPTVGVRNYQSFIIPLEKGFYPIKFEYLLKKNGAGFDFSYMIPDADNDSSIPQSLQYYIP